MPKRSRPIHLRRATAWLCTALGAAACQASSASLTPQDSPTLAAQDPAPVWTPQAPAADDFDWIQLTSGEWLKGEVILLRKDSFEFDSDELDHLSLDWGDIAELRSPRVNTVRLASGEVLVGSVFVTSDEIKITTLEGEHVFPRSDLYTLLSGTPSERNYWTGKASLGMTTRSGNTDQLDASTYVKLTRITARNRFLFAFDGNYSETDDVETSDNQRLDTSLRVYLDERFYLIPISLIASKDPFQNIALRATPGVGAGYVFIDRGDLEWEGTAGLGLLYTRYESAAPGEDDEDSSAALLLGTRIAHDLTKKVELSLGYDVQVALEEDNDVNHHADLRVEVDVYGDLDLDIGIVWDRVGDPAADDLGATPDHDDLRFTVGLGWSF